MMLTSVSKDPRTARATASAVTQRLSSAWLRVREATPFSGRRSAGFFLLGYSAMVIGFASAMKVAIVSMGG